jgi:hypothetical protein
VRFTRLVIEAGQQTVSLTVHPRLTVVAGVDERVRAGLSEELISGLGIARPGVHVELTDDRDRHLVVFRPTTGAPKVVDTEHGHDVSDQYRNDEGEIDVLGHHGIEARRARQVLHLDRSKLRADTHRGEIVRRLAEIDQTELWYAAARVRITADELQTLNADIGDSAEDEELVARIERRHHQLEAAVEQHVRLRKQTTAVCTVSLLAGLPVGLVSPAMSAPILAIGLLTILLAFIYRARIETAQRSEQSALADAGANSYLSYMVQRVNGMFDDTDARRRLVGITEEHRSASMAWTRLTGDVSVEWAMEHHDEIESAAQLREQLRGIGAGSSALPELDEETADVAQAVVSHLTRLRTIGLGGESFPLILDDPFTGVDPPTKTALLELLARTAGSPQVILLTDQPDVAEWARLEALTGEVALVEPAPEHRSEARPHDLAV